MNPVVSNWDDEYARLSRVASQIRSNSGVGGEEQQNVLVGLQRLKGQLNVTLSRMIPPAEVSRRRILVENLSRQISGGNNDVDLLGYGNTTSGAPPAQQSRAVQALQRQDDMIDELAGGVARLKDQTILIHEETGLHNRLIGEMTDDVELAHNTIEAETARALKLKEDRSVWRLYLAIFGLTFLLLWLVVTGF